jgi:CelD/BcsL family acetyltransferase involved in cellulose biosynthesis
MTEPSPFEVTVVRSATDLAAIRPAWQELAAHALEPNPLYEPWMALPALEAAAPPRGLQCVLVWNGERLEAMFPFERRTGLSGLTRGTLASWRHGSWMLGTPLIKAKSARASLGALFDWLEREGEPLAEFRYLPSDGQFYSALADALAERKAMVVATERFSRPLLHKARAGAQLAGGLRRDLARKERRLRERGALAYVVLRSDGDVQRWIEEFLELESAGWKGRHGSALACSAGNRRFAIAALSAAFQMKRLCMHGLDLGERPLARHCYLLAGEGSFHYRSAYNEDFRCYSPGTLAGLYGLRELETLPEVQWVDSMSDPEHPGVNRLWKDRRTIATLVVGMGAWGEFRASMLPLLKWARRRAAPTGRAAAKSASRV